MRKNDRGKRRMEVVSQKNWDETFIGKVVRITRGEHRNKEGIVLGRRIGGECGVQFLVGHVFVERPQRAVSVGVGEMVVVS